MYVICSMGSAASAMLSIIACASPSITGLFFLTVFFFSHKVVLSSAGRENAKKKKASFGGDCVGGWMGRKKHQICQTGKQSRQISLSCQGV